MSECFGLAYHQIEDSTLSAGNFAPCVFLVCVPFVPVLQYLTPQWGVGPWPGSLSPSELALLLSDVSPLQWSLAGATLSEEHSHSSLQTPNLKCCRGALILRAFPQQFSPPTSGLPRYRDALSSLHPWPGAPSWGEKPVQPSACRPLGLWVSTPRLYRRVGFFCSCSFTQTYSGYRGPPKESFCLHSKVPCFFTAVYQPGRGITFQLDAWSVLNSRRKEDKPLDKIGETQIYGVLRGSYKNPWVTAGQGWVMRNI